MNQYDNYQLTRLNAMLEKLTSQGDFISPEEETVLADRILIGDSPVQLDPPDGCTRAIIVASGGAVVYTTGDIDPSPSPIIGFGLNPGVPDSITKGMLMRFRAVRVNNAMETHLYVEYRSSTK